MIKFLRLRDLERGGLGRPLGGSEWIWGALTRQALKGRGEGLRVPNV